MPMISVEQIKQCAVYDRQGEKAGPVRDLLVDTDSGRVRYALVSAGGVLAALGLADKLIAVPCELFNVEPDRLTLTIGREQLQNAPAFSPDQVQAFSRDEERAVLHHFGLAPYWERPAATAAPPVDVDAGRTPEQEMIEPTGMLNFRTTEEMPLRPEAARREPGVYEDEPPSWERQRTAQPPFPASGDRGDEDIRQSA